MKKMMLTASHSQDSNPRRRHLTSVSLAVSLANIALLAAPHALAEAPPSDLAATALSVNTSPAIAGLAITVSHTVTGSGDEISEGWSDRFYLSDDEDFDGPGIDTYLGEVAVTGDDSYTLNTQLTLPENAAGKYHLLVVVDAGNAVTEYDESNNVASASFPITSGYPDLVPDSFSPFGEAVVGQPFSFEFRIRNIGISDTGSGPWHDDVYLSTDVILDEGDYPTGEPFTRSEVLGPDSTYGLERTYWIPSEAQTGQWYLIVKTDIENNVTEAEEQNNTAAYPITVRAPNLVPETIIAESEFHVQTSYSVTVTTYNRGDASAPGEPGWEDRLYLSQDATLDESDRLLADPVPIRSDLHPNDYYEQGFTEVILPADTPGGDYYLLAVADVANTVIESDETDNVRALPITVISRPNLRPTYVGTGVPIINNLDPTPPRRRVPLRRLIVLNSGQEEIIEYYVTNDGTAPADGSWWDTVYLSQDDTLDRGTDLNLGWVFRMNDPVVPWGSYSASFTANIPQWPVGEYYLIVATDDLFSVSESNEDDNIHAEQVSVVAPDLMPTDCTPVNSALKAGQDEDISYTITNIGEGSVSPHASWYDSIYLSDDPYYDGGDTQLYGVGLEYGPLSNGEPYTRNATIRVPDNKAPGTYYLIVYADYYFNGLFEGGNDENNSVAFQVTIVAPDLTPTVCVPVTPTLQSGRAGEIDCTVSNIGDGPVSATATWWDQVYLSEDQVLGVGDTNIGGGEASGPIDEGTGYDRRLSVNIPQVREGDYYLIIACDYPNNQVVESDNTNNIVAFPVRIDAVDLRPTSIVVNGASLKPGSVFDVNYAVVNDGMAPVLEGSMWYDLIYLSRDAVVDGSDTPLVYGPLQTPPMGHGDTYGNTLSPSLPAVMEPGDWYLIIRADAWWDQVKEGEESNNDITFSFYIGQTELWWAAGYNLHGNDALPEANPMGDGINNLMKYAFAMDPRVAYGPGRVLDPGTGTSGLPSVTVGNDSRLRVEFVRRIAAMDLGYQVQFGSGLGADDWSPAVKGSETTYPIDDDWERVIVTDLDAPPDSEKRFARVMLDLE